MSEWRVTVKLRSRRALHEYMEYHQLDTAYALAKKADILPGTAGHLVSGRRNTCSVRTARAIEEALACPPGFLFVPEMSQVADSAQPKPERRVVERRTSDRRKTERRAS